MGVFNIAQESSFEAGKLTFPEAFHMVMTNFLGKVIFFFASRPMLRLWGGVGLVVFPAPRLSSFCSWSLTLLLQSG